MSWLFALILLVAQSESVPDFQYWYNVQLINLYDADSGTFEIELGMGISVVEKCRLSRIDTWEIRGPERELGLQALEWADSLLQDKQLIIQTERDKKGKYGRRLIELYYASPGGNQWVNVNDLLVTYHHGEYVDY